MTSAAGPVFTLYVGFRSAGKASAIFFQVGIRILGHLGGDLVGDIFDRRDGVYQLNGGTEGLAEVLRMGQYPLR